MKSPTHAPVYLSLYPMLTEIAIAHGYSLCVHGSIVSDFDLVAVPWIDDATDPVVLVNEIAEYVSQVCGANHDLGSLVGPEAKPHGRLAWSIPLGAGASIDLSIMPKVPVNNDKPTPPPGRVAYEHQFPE